MDILEERVVKNPITSYRLIRRFVEVLPKIEERLSNKPEKGMCPVYDVMRKVSGKIFEF
jgi:hypothetical protein